MRSNQRVLITTLLAAPFGAAAVAAGCSGTDVSIAAQSARDGGRGGTSPEEEARAKDGGDVASADAEAAHKYPSSGLLARGKYIVDHLAVCGMCHTPTTARGVPDRSKYLAGVECLIRDEGGGCLHSANLTKLGGYTDEQIKAMFMDGKRPDGRFLHPTMPYWVFHNMTPKDADSVVAYLRSVREVDHVVPPNDPPFDDVPMPAEPIDPRTIPGADGAAAERGRYLAAAVGLCIDCHTPELPAGSERPIDMSLAFTGNRAFPNIVVAEAPTTVYSANITPQVVGGIGGWQVADIRRAIREGRDRSNSGICPPMPVGARGYGGMTEQDANDIAAYLLGLTPVNIRVTGSCSGP